jgi:hypothetical protein
VRALDDTISASPMATLKADHNFLLGRSRWLCEM